MRTLFITILFTIGVSFPGSILTSCCPDCGTTGPPFFDVVGISGFNHFSRLTTSQATTQADSGDVLVFDKYAYTRVDLSTTFLASLSEPSFLSDFNLMPSAYACDCDYYPGIQGAKTEALSMLTITVLEDFNIDILAGEDVTSLFSLNPMPDSSSLLSLQFLDMTLNIKPTHSDPIRFQVNISLSSGEEYTATTSPVGFI